MKIGIMGAMDSEIARFLEEVTDQQVHRINGFDYYEGIMAGKHVVITKSGVGKVNAAICATTFITHFQVKSVIFTGVAGALDPDLEIGDLVISKECQYHDMDVTALGFARGMIPYQETSIFPAEPSLIQWAEEAGKEMEGVQVKIGKVLSGDQFVSSIEAVKSLREELQGICVEMEGAAVAHVCYMLNVPYVVIRSMSDRADHSAHVNFAEFTVLAADRSYMMVQHLLHKMA